jgi:ribosome biogenesis protein NSA2
LDIIGVKKNPQSPLYTSLGVLTKGTIIEVPTCRLLLLSLGYVSRTWRGAVF